MVKGQKEKGKGAKTKDLSKTTPKSANEQDVTPDRQNEDDLVSNSTTKKSQSRYSRQVTQERSGLGNDPTELKMENEKLQRKI